MMPKKMKIPILLLLCVFAAGNAFAQSEIENKNLLGLKGYIECFSDSTQAISPNNIRIAITYRRVIEREIQSQFGSLKGNLDRIDTVLEFALASYYSPALSQIRPPEAVAMLPSDNPRLSGLILGANVLSDLNELRYLDPANTNAIGTYEGVLRLIQDKNRITRVEIEQFYLNIINNTTQ